MAAPPARAAPMRAMKTVKVRHARPSPTPSTSNSAATSVASSRRGIAAAAIGTGGNSNNTAILVNSCWGKMGLATAESVVDAGLNLVPVTFAAVDAKQVVSVRGKQVEVYPLADMDRVAGEIKQAHSELMAVDFTLPDAVNPNAEFYVRHGLPFVMGTTGGDRAKLFKTVEDAGLYAVIAANMGKQIVALQAMLDYAGATFPGAFSGYKLDVRESHQKTKVDTSGTAKDIVKSFNRLGMPLEEDGIVKVREEDEQVNEMGVPPEHINGHAFHTYTLTSKDETVQFEFQHNVCGRRFYAEGTVDALLFLRKKMNDKSEQKIFNMVDVLKAGAMR